MWDLRRPGAAYFLGSVLVRDMAVDTSIRTEGECEQLQFIQALQEARGDDDKFQAIVREYMTRIAEETPVDIDAHDKEEQSLRHTVDGAEVAQALSSNLNFETDQVADSVVNETDVSVQNLTSSVSTTNDVSGDIAPSMNTNKLEFVLQDDVGDVVVEHAPKKVDTNDICIQVEQAHVPDTNETGVDTSVPSTKVGDSTVSNKDKARRPMHNRDVTFGEPEKKKTLVRKPVDDDDGDDAYKTAVELV